MFITVSITNGHIRSSFKAGRRKHAGHRITRAFQNWAQYIIITLLMIPEGYNASMRLPTRILMNALLCTISVAQTCIINTMAHTHTHLQALSECAGANATYAGPRTQGV